ncbi:MAG: hypothetical protein ACRC2S_00945 [Waterburya sp.]
MPTAAKSTTAMPTAASQAQARSPTLQFKKYIGIIVNPKST